MLVCEHPGDQEDLAGKPFVGPAEQLLDRGLEKSGIDRNTVYVTNTVKHFKWEPRGKRRVDQKPSSRDIAACRPWLEPELRIVRRSVLVCVGSIAFRFLLSRHARARDSVRVGTRTPCVVTAVPSFLAPPAVG